MKLSTNSGVNAWGTRAYVKPLAKEGVIAYSVSNHTSMPELIDKEAWGMWAQYGAHMCS